MKRICGFNMIIGEKPKLLILGSVPSVDSLKKSEYYGHKRNQFWKIIYELFEKEYDESYDNRVELLKAKHIALWDVIKECEREGSLDNKIKEEEINDFDNLFRTYPSIKHVVFNGSKAYEVFRKKVGFSYDGIEFHKLCSTSPAHAVGFEVKLEEWSKIRDFI